MYGIEDQYSTPKAEYLAVKTTFKPLYEIAEKGGFDWFYYGLGRGVQRLCNYIKRSHTGIINLYLLWMIFGAAIILMLLILII